MKIIINWQKALLLMSKPQGWVKLWLSGKPSIKDITSNYLKM